MYLFLENSYFKGYKTNTKIDIEKYFEIYLLSYN